jgi:hypothetical protein
VALIKHAAQVTHGRGIAGTRRLSKPPHRRTQVLLGSLAAVIKPAKEPGRACVSIIRGFAVELAGLGVILLDTPAKFMQPA